MQRILNIIKGGSLLALSIVLFLGCGAAQEPLSQETWQKMESLMNSQNFVFVAAIAEPIGGQQFNLQGRVNYMSMQGDYVKMELPYFGSSRVAQPSGNRGIRFEGTATNIKIRKNENQNSYDMDFRIRNKSENFNCSLRLFSNNMGSLILNSTQRQSIRYEGDVRSLE